ncbi:MAG: GNAT family N-acetyltransferase [Novosphingobium sp.]
MSVAYLHVDSADALPRPSDVPAGVAGRELLGSSAFVLAWRHLEAGAGLPTQSHAFTSAMARTLLADAEIRLLVMPGRGGARAILPLCRDRGPFSRWRMVGAKEVFEPGDALYADRAGAKRLAEAIAVQSRAVSFDRLPASSELIPAVRAAMRGRGWVSVRPAMPSPTLALDASWSDPAARFNPGRRSDFRRAARKAAECGEVAYAVLSPEPAEFDALFDEAIAVEVRSWKRQAGTAIAVDPAKCAFFRDYFRAACAQGALRIAFMRVDGRAVAMQLAVEWGGRYWLFKIGFDEDFARCSPGTLLMLHTIGWAAARGLTAYEMLGDVEPWIAEFWTRDRHDCVRLRTYPRNLRGVAAFLMDLGRWARTRSANTRSARGNA